MDGTTVGLLGTAATLGLVHTAIGVDHYLPFVALARANDWSRRKLAWVTAACGLGHVLSSVVLGFVGIAAGLALTRLTGIESARGEWAGWLLLAFGLAYAVWGVRRAMRSKAHSHPHAHADGSVHEHRHDHHREHAHAHARRAPLMALFVIFVLGPCEALIPVLMAPAATESWWLVAAVASVFAVVTIGTMTVLSLAVHAGVANVAPRVFERWGHAFAGGTVALSGLLVTIGL